jgi:hypothetical protein
MRNGKIFEIFEYHSPWHTFFYKKFIYSLRNKNINLAAQFARATQLVSEIREKEKYGAPQTLALAGQG